MRCKELGIAAHLVKPIRQSELFDTILRVLGLSTTAAETMSEPGKPGAVTEPAQERALDILVAEDNTINQHLALRLLEKQGHRVILAGNGIEAIALWQKQRFDLVLMDVQMPEMSGLEATAAIRARELQTGQHIPIVAMTAHAMKGDRERCLAAGMDDYIPKPIQAQQLYEVVNRSTERGEGERSVDFFQDVDLPQRAEPETEGIVDLDAALERLGGDRELLESIVEMVLESCPSLMAKLCAAVLHRDAKSLEFAAHTLRGLIANFGAATACELALILTRFQPGD